MVADFFQLFFFLYDNEALDFLREEINSLVKKFHTQENFSQNSGKKKMKRKLGQFVTHNNII